MAGLQLDEPGSHQTLIDIQKRIEDAIASLGSTAKGVRSDLLIELPCVGKDLLVDFSVVHVTAVAILGKLKLFTTALSISDKVAAGVVSNNPTARVPSPALAAAEDLKRKRYATLMDIANRQLAAGKRERKPVLLLAIITHLGELGPGLITLVEEPTACAGRQYRPHSPFSCGNSKARTTAAFRTRMKMR